MKDYYKILGVEEEASGEEIRARWIELAKRYHPDLAKTKKADAKIKEINEAYGVLKSSSTRLEYDLERTFKKVGLRKTRGRKERKINIQKIILPAGILFFSLIVSLINFRWSHVAINPKSETHYEIDKILEKKTVSQNPPAKVESKIIEEKAVIPQESKKIVSVSPQRSPSGVESESKKKEESAQKILPRAEATAKVEEEVLAKQEPKPVKEPVPQVVVKSEATVSPPPLAKEEEVKLFVSSYIDQYHRKDIDGFLSFFSSKAAQNQKDGLKQIKSIYTEFFDQSQELRYHVEGMKIEIYQNAVDVEARFRVDQRLKESGKEKVWKGNIRWVLVKEDGALKISSLDYKNEKSP